MLGFGRRVIAYCATCNLAYNTTNVKDIAFHARIHKDSLIPKCRRVSEDLHQKGSTYYLGIREVEAKCTLRRVRGDLRISELFSISETAKKRLLALVRALHPEL